MSGISPPPKDPVTGVAEEDVRLCLSRICGSPEFAESKRLQGLLVYVVEETLAGRGSNIRAKTIGLDVYDYSTDEIAQREGVVRVDAGRLRRKLEDYYNGSGAADPAKVTLPVGTYRPSFATSHEEEGARLAKKAAPTSVILGAMVIAVTLVAGLYFVWSNYSPATDVSGPSTKADLVEIYDVSPARVEAANLAAEGRDLIFPAVDVNRLMLALHVFEAAVAKDDTYFGGYAGAAQVQATLALLSPDETEALIALEKASRYGRRALGLQPDAAWALSAAAWVSFARDDAQSAVELSHRAVEAAPTDPHVLEFDALVSLYTSDFGRIINFAQQRNERGNSDKNFVFENVLGSAMFHTEDYRGAIAQFEDAIQSGAPFGPISVAYLAASYQLAGDTYEAGRLARLLTETWPKANVIRVKRRLFVQTAPVEKLEDALSHIEKSE